MQLTQILLAYTPTIYHTQHILGEGSKVSSESLKKINPLVREIECGRHTYMHTDGGILSTAGRRRSEYREDTTTTTATLIAQFNNSTTWLCYQSSVKLKWLNASDTQSELKVLYKTVLINFPVDIFIENMDNLASYEISGARLKHKYE